jgi:riboflavin kinase/FMN adenylyltransferase
MSRTIPRLTGNTPIPAEFRGGVVALGNFDGVHAGHQAVIGRAVEMARAAGVPALVATFDPHPVTYFRPDTPPFRLTTLDQREELFAAAGAAAMLVIHFDRTVAAMTAPECTTG